MGKLTLSSFQKNNATAVSNIFLDGYMGDANGEFVKVYLYLLRCMNGSPTGTGISLSDIADRLNLTEKDVVRALKYWNKTNVLNVVFDAGTGEPASVTILALDSDGDCAASAEPMPEADTDALREPPSDSARAGTVSSDKPSAPAAVSYSSAQLKLFGEREDIKQLLYIIEKYIGKPLTASDINKILYFRESLKFAPELIEYLAEYCVSNRHSSLHYMEKVALSWYDRGISTIEEAKSSSAIYIKRNNPVIKAFGISDRRLTPIELDFIERWYDEYGFDGEMITEACQQTVLALGKPNFRYADRILCKWKSAEAHTLEDVKRLSSAFKAKITVPAGTKPQASPVKTNRFNNFSQRTYDFDAMEKNLISNDK
ncbi:MAG: DnaD domain protein [Butyrivibrio sp.]|nr:DnaD domain protein [Butyrivibrio sp.]